MPDTNRKVHSVEKAIMLLDCFWKAGGALSLAELAAATQWPKSTVHNLLSSMLDSSVVEQSPIDGKYRLGLHLFEYGCVISEQWNVVKLAKPHLNALVAKTGESAYLATLNSDKLLIVDGAEPNNVFRVVSTVGTRLPLHCSSQGKAILAHADETAVRRLLKREGMKSFTLKTTKSPDAFIKEMKSIRQSGIASEIEEYRNGLCSFSAPIFDHEGICRSAVGIVCIIPSGGHMESLPASVKNALKATAEAISTELGYHG